MQLSSAAIRQLCPKAALAEEATTLNDRLDQFGITTPLRLCHLLAQLAHESAGFSRLEEDLRYSAKAIRRAWPRLSDRADALAYHPEALANAAYGGRQDLENGPESSGDGWNYRGRGWIMLTGRKNYRLRGAAISQNLLQYPERAARPGTASILALEFWHAAGCNHFADADDVEGVTTLVNGPKMLGLAERTALLVRAKTIFMPAEVRDIKKELLPA
jgi:putative chitinase